MASYEIIEPDKNGKPRIRITVEFGYDEAGKRLRKRKNVTLPKLTEANIINAITQFEKSVGITDVVINKATRITFRDFSKKFMDDYVRVELKVKSRNTYETYLNQGLVSYFDKMLLHKITSTQINLFFVQQKKLNARSLIEKHGLLKSMFNRAIEWGYIDKNPVNNVKKPSRSINKKANYYNINQIELLLKIIDNLHVKHRLQIKLALYCGLRMSEIAGLRFNSIDFENNEILVNKTLQYDKESKRHFLDTTKTDEIRVVIAPSGLIAELKDYIETKHKKLTKLSLGDKCEFIYDQNKKPIYLIFSKDNGYPNHPDRMSKQWSDIVRQYNLPKITFHGLRHTFASYMLSQNVNIKVIQEQLGHKNIKETLNTYSHIDREQKLRASELFDNL